MRRVLIIAVAVLLAGCGNLEFPGVYRLAIDQGNIITQEMVDQLEPGMSRSQVQFIMGTALIDDTFHPNRWDYIYTFRDGDGHYTQERLTVFFRDDKLHHFSGDLLPSTITAANEAINETADPVPNER